MGIFLGGASGPKTDNNLTFSKPISPIFEKFSIAQKWFYRIQICTVDRCCHELFSHQILSETNERSESYDHFKMVSGPKRVRSSATLFGSKFRSFLRRSHPTISASTKTIFETVIDPAMIDIHAKFCGDRTIQARVMNI